MNDNNSTYTFVEKYQNMQSQREKKIAAFNQLSMLGLGKSFQVPFGGCELLTKPYNIINAYVISIPILSL